MIDEPQPDEPHRVARIWSELDGDDLEKVARRALAEQALAPPIERG